MTRVFNFSAGPAALPEPVLRQASEEMLDWHGSGVSVMEMSHRGKEFMSIHAQAQALLRELLDIPANYKTLFMQGGAIAENAIVPMNMLRGKASADYIDTGEWSRRSIEEAQRYRQKIQEYRDELEVLQSDKLRELKLRESEAWERIKNRERDLDKQAFEQR